MSGSRYEETFASQDRAAQNLPGAALFVLVLLGCAGVFAGGLGYGLGWQAAAVGFYWAICRMTDELSPKSRIGALLADWFGGVTIFWLLAVLYTSWRHYPSIAQFWGPALGTILFSFVFGSRRIAVEQSGRQYRPKDYEHGGGILGRLVGLIIGLAMLALGFAAAKGVLMLQRLTGPGVDSFWAGTSVLVMALTVALAMFFATASCLAGSLTPLFYWFLGTAFFLKACKLGMLGPGTFGLEATSNWALVGISLTGLLVAAIQMWAKARGYAQRPRP